MEILSSFFNPRIKPKHPVLEVARYTFVSFIALLVDFAILFVLTSFAHVYYLFSALIAFTLGVTVNYSLSRLWVFSSRRVKNVTLEVAVFTVIGVVGLGINEALLWLFTEKLLMYYLISKLLATFFVFAWNFSARKMLLFSGNPNV